MAANKVNTRRDSRQMPAVPPRLASQTRVRSPVQREEASPPSTLPPPPFEHEVAVVGLEWWLEAHMEVVGELALLEQLVDGDEGSPHASTMQLLTAHAEAVRDALYELYCDAADPRVAPLLGSDAPLEQHVRCCYAWCGRVVAMLGALAHGIRSEAGPDWALAKKGFRSASVMYVGPSQRLRAAVQGLAIDSANPTEPLRNLLADLDAMFHANEQLQNTLAKRFG